METELYPMTFQPIYRDFPWGGSRIRERYRRTGAPDRCAESWEIAAHLSGSSVVREGPLAGRNLSELMARHGQELCGTLCGTPQFPLLIKLIDAHERLSVQVHPNDDSAERYGGEPKTEAWYILEALPGSVVYSGLRPDVGPRKFHDAVVDKQIPMLLRTLPAISGKALYTPGGMVHAIGEGCLVLEVQQNSNTTYRVYDWDRTGADGRPRELHIKKAMEVIDWRAPDLGLLSPIPAPANVAENPRQRILKSDFFQLHRTRLTVEEPVVLEGSTFHALFVAEGDAEIGWGGEGQRLRLACGQSCLVPAALSAYELFPAGDSTPLMLTISL